MILGKFVDKTELAIDFVVDTGFNDYLTLPPQAVAALNLTLDSIGTMRLADGSISSISIYVAEINWNDLNISVPVVATGSKPLLDTGLLQGFRLTIDFIPDGAVRLEKL